MTLNKGEGPSGAVGFLAGAQVLKVQGRAQGDMGWGRRPVPQWPAPERGAWGGRDPSGGLGPGPGRALTLVLMFLARPA